MYVQARQHGNILDCIDEVLLQSVYLYLLLYLAILYVFGSAEVTYYVCVHQRYSHTFVFVFSVRHHSQSDGQWDSSGMIDLVSWYTCICFF